MNRFVPDLAAKCFSFREILRKDALLRWTEMHESAFQQVNKSVRELVELTHMKRGLPLRIMCDASKEGLSIVLQQFEQNAWKPITFASQFLTEFETKYSMNELELLAVVWAIEYFRNYVYGTKFEVVSDHRALLNVLKK